MMNSQDGLDILIDVASARQESGTPTTFISPVLEEGRNCQSSGRWSRTKQLEDMMTFTGYVPDAELLEILSTADVCVNPDRPCQMNSMSTMIKIMEYMALGKPIVQFDGTEGRFSAQEASLYSDGRPGRGGFCGKTPVAVGPSRGEGTDGPVRAQADRERAGLGVLRAEPPRRL